MKGNAYDTLGVDKGADAATVKKAYRKRARQTHPDKPGGNKEAFQQVQRAYGLLKDSVKRAAYDQFGDAADSVKTLRTQAEETLAQLAIGCASTINPRTGYMLDPERDDMWQPICDCIRQNKTSIATQQRQSQDSANRFRKAAKRWKRKSGEESKIVQALEASAEECDKRIKAAKFEIAKCDEMIVVLNEHVFERGHNIGILEQLQSINACPAYIGIK